MNLPTIAVPQIKNSSFINATTEDNSITDKASYRSKFKDTNVDYENNNETINNSYVKKHLNQFGWKKFRQMMIICYIELLTCCICQNITSMQCYHVRIGSYQIQYNKTYPQGSTKWSTLLQIILRL